jgi:hypothetical protein
MQQKELDMLQVTISSLADPWWTHVAAQPSFNLGRTEYREQGETDILEPMNIMREERQIY